ncbi:MAG: hypothetical protein HY017_22565 [Betaproteobacteria bacterium]|nr:hypothetical protein [Betaproteobacteria bacterium]
MVLIERGLGGGYETFDMPAPAETTLDAQRFRVEVPAGKISEFVAQERLPRAREESLTDLSHMKLQRYFAHKMLDQKAYDGLKALLDVWAEIAGLEKSIAEHEKQRAGIRKAQEQIQKNMAALSNAGDEGKLRGRYVKQLGDSEEQLADNEATVLRVRAEIAARQADAERMIAALGAT